MAGFHVIAGAGDTLEHVVIRKIGISDIFDAFMRGVDDFMVKPSHIVFLCLIYPLVGVFLAAWTSGNNALPLLFPLISGFALIGPFAAIGLWMSVEQDRKRPWRIVRRLGPGLLLRYLAGRLTLIFAAAHTLAAAEQIVEEAAA